MAASHDTRGTAAPQGQPRAGRIAVRVKLTDCTTGRVRVFRSIRDALQTVCLNDVSDGLTPDQRQLLRDGGLVLHGFSWEQTTGEVTEAKSQRETVVANPVTARLLEHLLRGRIGDSLSKDDMQTIVGMECWSMKSPGFTIVANAVRRARQGGVPWKRDQLRMAYVCGGQAKPLGLDDSVTSYFEKKYKPLKLRSASPSSLKLWQIAISAFASYLGRPAELTDLNDDTVSAFATWRVERVSAATTNRDLASLLALWRFAHRMGDLERWPTVEMCKEPRRTPVAWSEQEFNLIIDTAKKQTGNVGEIPARLWWHALLLTLFDSGERITAVLSLRWAEVNLDEGWLRFPAETRKGKDADSVVPLAQDTVEALRAIKRDRGDVFPWPYCMNYVWNRYKAMLDSAGLPYDRQRMFHCVRRTVASHVEAAGGDATSVLRHSCRRTTLGYLDPRITKPKGAIDFLWRPAAVTGRKEDVQ